MLSKMFRLVLILIILEEIMAQIGFPERFETDKKKLNLAGRLPLYSPTRCKHDELLYPGDQINDWICDCAPAAIYHPESDACFPAFRQGPCPTNEFLVLRPNNVVPECIPNVCKNDGEIQISNTCYQFGNNPPCGNINLSYVLGVDPHTLLVDCVKLSISLSTRFSESEEPTAPIYDFENIEQCARGSKRAHNGECKKNKKIN